MAWSQCMTTIPRGLLNVKLIEPPCTERYARWCERSKISHFLRNFLLLDYYLSDILRISSGYCLDIFSVQRAMAAGCGQRKFTENIWFRQNFCPTVAYRIAMGRENSLKSIIISKYKSKSLPGSCFLFGYRQRKSNKIPNNQINISPKMARLAVIGRENRRKRL